MLCAASYTKAHRVEDRLSAALADSHCQLRALHGVRPQPPLPLCASPGTARRTPRRPLPRGPQHPRYPRAVPYWGPGRPRGRGDLRAGRRFASGRGELPGLLGNRTKLAHAHVSSSLLMSTRHSPEDMALGYKLSRVSARGEVIDSGLHASVAPSSLLVARVRAS
ncbi:hypothetical protein OH76DRAFT_255307 [Lentinus brumalis]|uniref:Uncharacterized protein n=1 Tax=Lentinus brumalis TaxID=2498619 RepID=A0A371CLB2_9APHY|nr:hypothetical protein OH76DRAFT_255307 [Polyporus brumalis]